jgi:hypothetical protein
MEKQLEVDYSTQATRCAGYEAERVKRKGMGSRGWGLGARGCFSHLPPTTYHLQVGVSIFGFSSSH